MDNSQLPAYPVRRFDEDGRPFLDKRDSGLTKLEAFTMAAMKSLIINTGCSTWNATYNTEGCCDDIATGALNIARTTLTELQKIQANGQCISGSCKLLYSSDYKELRPMPKPSEVDIESSIFTWVWDTIKHWKIQAPDFYEGTLEVNGSHVKLIIDAIQSTSNK